MSNSEDQITRGRALHRLMGNGDFAVFLEELESRRDEYLDGTERVRRGVTSDASMVSSLDRYQCLRDLRNWIDDEIQAGSKELEKQHRAYEGASK